MHGGARPGSGRKRALIDEKRLVALVNQGVTMTEIARRFGVTRDAIKYAIKNPVKAVQKDEEHRPTARAWDSGESQG
jgi:transposase-like protein